MHHDDAQTQHTMSKQSTQAQANKDYNKADTPGKETPAKVAPAKVLCVVFFLNAVLKATMSCLQFHGPIDKFHVFWP